MWKVDRSAARCTTNAFLKRWRSVMRRWHGQRCALIWSKFVKIRKLRLAASLCYRESRLRRVPKFYEQLGHVISFDHCCLKGAPFTARYGPENQRLLAP